jgi:sulfur carrier protein
LRIELNGEPAELPARATVADAVQALVEDPRGVAVAVDAEVIPRAQWEQRALHENAKVEVLRAIQGG